MVSQFLATATMLAQICRSYSQVISLRPVLSAALLLVLSGCVTVTDGPFTTKASAEKSLDNYTQLGLGYLQRGRPDWARQRLQRALAIDSDYPPANDAMGLVWQLEGENELAEQHFKHAIRIDKTFTLAKHHLGKLYSDLRQYQLAERYLRAATDDKFYLQRASAFNDRAINAYLNQQPEMAVDYYRQTLRLAPYNVDALVNAATIQFEQRQYEESNNYYQRFQRLVERQQSAHSANSLWLGIRLADVRRDQITVNELAMTLARLFPQSEQYRLYQNSFVSGLSRNTP